MTGTLYTAGYGNRRPEWFFAQLPESAVIVDVRRTAAGWSPQYSGKQLSARFAGRYYHRPTLGNTSGSAEIWESPSPEWVDRELHYLAMALKHGENVLLLCAEKDHGKCHRRFVAAAIAARVDGLQVVHLLEEESEHNLHQTM